jgi:hypothetical protein
MTRWITRLIAAVAITVGMAGMGVGVANASPAPATNTSHVNTVTPNCQNSGAMACSPLVCDGNSIWTDGITYGITCFPGFDYQIGVLCANGQRAYSAWESPGVKAYSYCSSHNSRIASPLNIAFYWN